MVQRIRDGLPAVEPPKAAFKTIVAEFLARHVDKRELIPKPEIERRLSK